MSFYSGRVTSVLLQSTCVRQARASTKENGSRVQATASEAALHQ